MSTPSVILLTRDRLEHRYVARALAQELPGLKLIVESGSRTSTRKSIQRAWKHGFGTFMDKIGRTIYLRMLRDPAARKEALIRHLGDPAESQSLFGQATQVLNVNDPEAIQAIHDCQPQLVLVYGTGLVKPKLLKEAGCPVLNLHTGLSPYYRGVACYLWPLAEDRLDRVGYTVHDCVAELDAGGILSNGVITPQPGDGVHDVFARQVKAGASDYARCAAAELTTPLERQPQDLDLGREYRGVTLGYSAERAARRRLARLASKGQ